jgi:putative transcriptional regulator
VDSLRGSLLIASPSLDDYFRRAIVLVLEHRPEGAMGVVLNRASESTLGDALPQLAHVAPDPEEPVHVGGPVSPESVVALGEFEDPQEAARLVVGNVGVVDPNRLDVSLSRLRVFAGYAGWAPEQLEAELEAAAWIVEPAIAEDAFHDGDLWSHALQRKGGAYALLARMPADPSMN